METGKDRAFVISWSQTAIDRMPAAPVASLCVGVRWRWMGEPLVIDRPCELAACDTRRMDNASLELVTRDKMTPDLTSDAGCKQTDRRRRVACAVRKLVGAAIDPSRPVDAYKVENADLNIGFEVTDGHSSYIATLIFAPVDGADDACLLVFGAEIPPPDRDLWVVRANLTPDQENRLAQQPVGVIRLCRGTRLRTPGGETRIEDIAKGDQVLTRDHGAQRVLWTAQPHMSGADPSETPHGLPVCLRGGALCPGQPDADLIVSGGHQILLRGRRARDLYGEDEVLVSARDLLDERRVVVERAHPALTEHFIVLTTHEVVWANAVQIESFHPVNSGLHSLEAGPLARLVARYPYLAYEAAALAPFIRSAEGADTAQPGDMTGVA